MFVGFVEGVVLQLGKVRLIVALVRDVVWAIGVSGERGNDLSRIAYRCTVVGVVRVGGFLLDDLGILAKVVVP